VLCHTDDALCKLPVLAAIVVGSLTAGVSYASIPDGGGVIHGCYKPSNKASPLKVIDTAKASQCPSGTPALRGTKGCRQERSRTPSRRSGRLR